MVPHGVDLMWHTSQEMCYSLPLLPSAPPPVLFAAAVAALRQHAQQHQSPSGSLTKGWSKQSMCQPLSRWSHRSMVSHGVVWWHTSQAVSSSLPPLSSALVDAVVGRPRDVVRLRGADNVRAIPQHLTLTLQPVGASVLVCGASL
jgi:hypothetical protein